MRRFSIPAVLGLLCFLVPAGRADDKGDDLRKILREVEALRQIADKEARARSEETKALRTALEEARQELLKAHQQIVDLTAKVALAESEQQRQAKNAAIEKFAAEVDKREPRPADDALPAAKPEPQPLGELPAPRPTARPFGELPAPSPAARPDFIPPEKPGLDVRGKITSVSETGLYLLSLGADDGLKQGDVVEVIRAGEAPKILGTLSLVRAYAKQSIGEFKALGKDRPAVGDDIGVRIPAK